LSEENLRDILIRMAQKLDDHVDRYDRDRSEITDRVAADKIEQRTFREEIVSKVEGLEKQINPIVADHNRVKWLARLLGVGAVTAAGSWLWEYLKSHFAK
jgi:hypothetical protein